MTDNQFERAKRMIQQALWRMTYATESSSPEERSAYADLAVEDLKTALSAFKAVSRHFDDQASPSYIAIVTRD